MNVGSLSRSALKDKIPTEDHTLQWRAARLHFRLQGVMPRTLSFGAIDVQLHRTSSADRTRTEHMARHRRGGLHRFQPVADAAVTRAARRGPRQLPHRVSAQSGYGTRTGHPGAVGAVPFHRRRHPRRRNLPSGLPGRRARPARSGARLCAPLHRKPDHDQRLQH